MTKPNRKPEDKEPGGGGGGSANLEDAERNLQAPPLPHPLNIHRVPHSDEETLIPNVTETRSPINCHVMVRRCQYSRTLTHNLNCNMPFTPGRREASNQLEKTCFSPHLSCWSCNKNQKSFFTAIPPSPYPQHLKRLEFCYLIR